MDDLNIIEDYYTKYKKELKLWLPEDLLQVDIPLLQHFGLLEEDTEDDTPHYFHMIESYDKMTLVNSQFIVWIVAERIDNIPATTVMIAHNKPSHPHLELAFIAAGVYNSSRLILRLLDKFLIEIEENERLLTQLKTAI